MPETKVIDAKKPRIIIIVILFEIIVIYNDSEQKLISYNLLYNILIKSTTLCSYFLN